MRRILSLLSMCCLLLAVAPAHGQTQNKDESYRHFLAAKRLEARGNYEAAAHEYLEAYVFFQSPEFFYNAGRAYELHRSFAKAIEYYRKYLALAPNGRAAELARAAIARLQPEPVEPRPEPGPRDVPAPGQGTSTDVSEQHPAQGSREGLSPEKADRSGDEQPASTPHPALGPRTPPPRGSGTTPGSTIDLAPNRRARADRGRTARISGLLAGGAGLASLSVGIFFGIEARHLAGDIEAVRRQWTDADLSKYPEGNRAGMRAIVLTGAGTAMLLGGGALYVWGARRARAEDREQLSLTPSISPGNTGLSVTGVF